MSVSCNIRGAAASRVLAIGFGAREPRLAMHQAGEESRSGKLTEITMINAEV